MKTNIKRDDFLENQVLSNIKINKNQNRAAFTVSKASLEKNGYEDSLWVINLDNNSLKELKLEGNVKGFKWKDNFIIYFILKDSNSIFYRYDIDINSSERLFYVPMVVGAFILLQNKLFFTSTNSIIERTSNVQEGTELPFYSEGVGLTSDYRKSLYSYNISEDKISKITDEDIDIESLVGDESGNKIAFISSVKDKYIRNENIIYLLDTESEKFQLVSRQASLRISNAAFFDKDTIIFAGSDLKVYGRQENHDFYTIDINTKEEIKITESFDKSSAASGIATDARFGQSNSFYIYENQVFFLTVENSNVYVNKINMNGEHEKLSIEAGAIDSFAVLKDSIIFIGLRGQALHEIYLLKDKKENRLTSFNYCFTENHIITKPEEINYINAEGNEIQGWVIVPDQLDENKKYPGILCIHGGPNMVYSSVYYHMMQLLSAQGYFVFFCNPRGSSGRGNDFTDIRGNFAAHAFSDIMGFTEAVLEKYIHIDENRLGVMGGSYGGYMTNYVITHTTKFSAAVSERGISNAISMFNTSDIGYTYMADYLGECDPWNNIDTYLKDSPIMYANKVKTPTLFIHGKKDNRCNYTESLQMYSALKYFGVDSKLCLFEEESHSLEVKGKPLNKIKRFDEIIKWVNKYLR